MQKEESDGWLDDKQDEQDNSMSLPQLNDQLE